MSASSLILPCLIALNNLVLDQPIVVGENVAARGIPDLPVKAWMLMTLLGAGLWLTGLATCYLAPVESRARPLAMAAIICWIFSLIVTVQASFSSATGIVPQRAPREEERGPLGNNRNPVRFATANDHGFLVAGSVLAGASAVFTLCFVCVLADHFRNKSLVRAAHRVLLFEWFALVACLFLALIYMNVPASRNLTWYWATLALASLLIAMAACILFVHLLKRVRQTIQVAENNTRTTSAEK